MSKFADIHIDPAIVRRAARGDRKAHEIIYRAYSAPVYSVCLRFTRVPAQAEDLLQETFIEVIRSIGGFRGEAPGWNVDPSHCGLEGAHVSALGMAQARTKPGR